MSKLLVKTTGEFQLICPLSGQLVQMFRPYVVENTAFFQTRIACGDLSVVTDGIDDAATDESWAATLAASDGNQELAIAAYKAELTGVVEGSDGDADAAAKASVEAAKAKKTK
jgi:hypothetical protein